MSTLTEHVWHDKIEKNVGGGAFDAPLGNAQDFPEIYRTAACGGRVVEGADPYTITSEEIP